MKLQSAIASTVTVIAGILVCIVVRLPIGLPPAPWPCVLYFCMCEYFDKLTKLVTYRRYSNRRNLCVDLLYRDHGYSPCAMWAGSLTKKPGRGAFFANWTKVAGNCMRWIDPLRIFSSEGGGLFCQLNQSCWKLHEMDRSSHRFFSFGGGGGLFCQVTVHDMFNDAWNTVAKLCHVTWYGRLFFQVTVHYMFNDAWNTVWQS